MIIEAHSSSPWYSQPWWNTVAAIGQIVGSVVAGFAAFMAKRAAHAAEKSVEAASTATMLQEAASRHRDRAYVTLTDVKGTQTLTAFKIIETTFIFKNVGATPAHKVRFGAGFLLKDAMPTEEELDGQLVLEAMGPLVQSIPVPIRCVLSDEHGQIALTDAALMAIKQQQAFVIAWTKITYEDVFGLEHVSKAAHQYDIEVDGFRFASFYNSMT